MATWAQLLRLARDQLADTNAVAWTDEEITDYFQEAIEQMCRRGHVYRVNLDQITIVNGTADYAWPTSTNARSIDISRLKWEGSAKPLEPTTTYLLDQLSPRWSDASGNPTHYITDKETRYFTLYPTPDANAVATSSVITPTAVCVPELTLTEANFNDGSSPIIEEEYHFELVDYVLYRCFNKEGQPDSYTKKADRALGKFESNIARARLLEMRQRGAARRTPLMKIW